MQRWEYVNVRWVDDSGIWLWPISKFDPDHIQEWLKQQFPQCRNAKVDQVGVLNRKQGPLFYRLHKLSFWDSEIAMALAQHLGSMGWELVAFSPADTIAPAWQHGEVWFKRPIPETTTGTEGSGS